MENKSPCEFDIINLSYERIKTGRRVRKRLKAVGAENRKNQSIYSAIPKYACILKDLCGCKTASQKKVWVQKIEIHQFMVEFPSIFVFYRNSVGTKQPL